MKNALKFLLAGLAAISLTAFAGNTNLHSYYSLNIDAPASRIWDAIKDFDALDVWHPLFSSVDYKSRANNEVGAVRTLTIIDGPSFDEELLAWDANNKTYTYRVIDPTSLPLKQYQSTMQVIQLESGVSNVTWRSSYQNNSNGEIADEELIELLNRVYKAGLEQVRTLVTSMPVSAQDYYRGTGLD